MEYYAESRLKEAVELLKDLISIPSVTGNEWPLGEYIVKKFIEFGADEAYLQPVEGNRCNVIGSVKGAKEGRTILLTGHLDVVGPGDGWETDPFVPVEKDGRIFGRGANDMKAGIAIIMECVKIAAANKSAFSGALKIGLLCDEEAYSAGAIEYAKAGVCADFGLSAEPEFHMIEVGAAGKMLISVIVEGKSAHAAEPQNGINAVEEAARFVSALERISVLQHEKIPGQPFVTLKLNGGIKEYSLIIPDRCEVLINKHTVPGETKEKVLDSLESLVSELGLRAKFTFSVGVPFYPPFSVPEDNRYVAELRRRTFEITGKEIPLGYGDGVCDSNYLVPALGFPIVNYGPAGGNMHAPNEWVDIEKIGTVMKVYLKFLFEPEEDRR